MLKQEREQWSAQIESAGFTIRWDDVSDVVGVDEENEDRIWPQVNDGDQILFQCPARDLASWWDGFGWGLVYREQNGKLERDNDAS